MDENFKVLTVHIISLSSSLISIYLTIKIQVYFLIAEKVNIPKEYSNFSNVFSEKKAMVLPEITNLNQYVIKQQ